MGGYLRSEVLRYAGMGQAGEAEIDPRIDEFADRAVEELQRVCRPRFTSKIFSLEAISGLASGAGGGLTASDMAGSPVGQENGLRFGDVLEVTSRSLTVNLADCEKAVFFAATLGAEADQLISRYSRRDISQGVLTEAAATALIEDYCDRCQAELEKELNRKKLTLRPRFSPGYGDFDIIHQKDMVHLLDLPRQIGVTLTDGGMLAPSKSVTAVMGIARLDEDPLSGGRYGQTQRCHIHGCESCLKKDCIYRRNR